MRESKDNDFNSKNWSANNSKFMQVGGQTPGGAKEPSNNIDLRDDDLEGAEFNYGEENSATKRQKKANMEHLLSPGQAFLTPNKIKVGGGRPGVNDEPRTGIKEEEFALGPLENTGTKRGADNAETQELNKTGDSRVRNNLSELEKTGPIETSKPTHNLTTNARHNRQGSNGFHDLSDKNQSAGQKQGTPYGSHREDPNDSNEWYENYTDRDLPSNYEDQQPGQCCACASCRSCKHRGPMEFFSGCLDSITKGCRWKWNSHKVASNKPKRNSPRDPPKPMPADERLAYTENGISYLNFCMCLYRLRSIDLNRPINKFSFLSLGSGWMAQAGGDPEQALLLLKKC